MHWMVRTAEMISTTFITGTGLKKCKPATLSGCSHCAAIEFKVEINGITVNGVDMMTWDESGQIIDFKVMVRPLKAVSLIHENMGKMLAAQK